MESLVACSASLSTLQTATSTCCAPVVVTSRIRWDEKDARFVFTWKSQELGSSGKTLSFQTTAAASGGRRAEAERICLLCRDKIRLGATKADTLTYRDQLYLQLHEAGKSRQTYGEKEKAEERAAARCSWKRSFARLAGGPTTDRANNTAHTRSDAAEAAEIAVDEAKSMLEHAEASGSAEEIAGVQELLESVESILEEAIESGGRAAPRKKTKHLRHGSFHHQSRQQHEHEPHKCQDQKCNDVTISTPNRAQKQAFEQNFESASPDGQHGAARTAMTPFGRSRKTSDGGIACTPPISTPPPIAAQERWVRVGKGQWMLERDFSKLQPPAAAAADLCTPVRSKCTPDWEAEALQAACCVCGGCDAAEDNDLALCDGCDRGYHQNCHKPRVSSFGGSDDQWFCAFCTVKATPAKKARVASPDRDCLAKQVNLLAVLQKPSSV
eukprot:TRINITY_DN19424_c0_g1_i1.p1 TRINITY_DN19424_c0_g1~~TRINITY_DN19424_c0_g1_i1.p1  ORF type:complete len:454 (+),score=79.89 TRINITY_DN19424_c0_g1_i1:41-1363(+)